MLGLKDKWQIYSIISHTVAVFTVSRDSTVTRKLFKSGESRMDACGRVGVVGVYSRPTTSWIPVASCLYFFSRSDSMGITSCSLLYLLLAEANPMTPPILITEVGRCFPVLLGVSTNNLRDLSTVHGDT
ncbi:hypothetical protein Y032_0009g786 [Ancylostoma ceylanicum]|uniref:Uncharacterized protein n=1 Tax=Ancylostoma ceylanicum TaxID=53326 RepID=A0A016VJI0_9BILA|nr:hypothetical protein Y032_0009g786 [Ancylostoma ceylanicum]